MINIITSSLISTICYDDVLDPSVVIKRLRDMESIDFGLWIKHKPDEDDKKEHYHILLQPSSRVDTNLLRNSFFCGSNGDGQSVYSCLPFRKTLDINHWLLYSLHDENYLNSKMQERKFHYCIGDLKSTEDEDFICRVYCDAYESSLTLCGKYLELFRRGLTPADIIMQNKVAYNAIGNLYKLYFAYCDKYHLPKD